MTESPSHVVWNAQSMFRPTLRMLSPGFAGMGIYLEEWFRCVLLMFKQRSHSVLRCPSTLK
eukprot:4514339-Amphidinium_carterae.1